MKSPKHIRQSNLERYRAVLANTGTKTLSEYSSCDFQVSKQKATYSMVKSENVKADIAMLGQCIVVY